MKRRYLIIGVTPLIMACSRLTIITKDKAVQLINNCQTFYSDVKHLGFDLVARKTVNNENYVEHGLDQKHERLYIHEVKGSKNTKMWIEVFEGYLWTYVDYTDTTTSSKTKRKESFSGNLLEKFRADYFVPWFTEDLNLIVNDINLEKKTKEEYYESKTVDVLAKINDDEFSIFNNRIADVITPNYSRHYDYEVFATSLDRNAFEEVKGIDYGND